MYGPSLAHLLIQVHIQELHRSRQTPSTQPSTTSDRIATRHRIVAKFSAYLARAIERFGSYSGPEAPAF
jgi:hypothetical protein